MLLCVDPRLGTVTPRHPPSEAFSRLTDAADTPAANCDTMADGSDHHPGANHLRPDQAPGGTSVIDLHQGFVQRWTYLSGL